MEQCNESRHYLIEQKPLPASETLYSLIGMMQRLKKDQQHNKYVKKWNEPKDNMHLVKLGSARDDYLGDIADAIKNQEENDLKT